MGQVTSLSEVVRQLAEYDCDSTIYALEPWTDRSAAVVAVEPDSGGLPAEAAAIGLAYFLEVKTARDFIKDWQASLNKQPDLVETCNRLISYAINDA